MKSQRLTLAGLLGLAMLLCPLGAMAEGLPKLVRVSTFGVGTTGHALVTGMAQAIRENTGMRMLPVPRETETGRFLSVRTREAELVFTTALSVSAPLVGITEFGAEAWGPQTMYRVWMGPNRAGWVASVESGIKTLYDIKGKRIPIWPGSSGRLATDALLAYANLTWKDVTQVKCPTFGGQIRAAMNNKTDLWWLGLYAAYTIRIASKPQGARVVDIPPSDKKAFARMRKIAPFFSSWHYKGLPGKNKEAWSTSYPYVFYCYPWLSEEVAYALTKGFYEGYNQYKNKHPELKLFTPQYALDLKYLPKGYPPYHPGSVKFFKEKGVWTKELQAWQDMCILLAKERLIAWDEAKKQAKKKKISLSSPKWRVFWENYLVDYLTKKGLSPSPARRVAN